MFENIKNKWYNFFNEHEFLGVIIAAIIIGFAVSIFIVTFLGIIYLTAMISIELLIFMLPVYLSITIAILLYIGYNW